jgi:6,7-dimethyl-8-ribityllumazine synthase
MTTSKTPVAIVAAEFNKPLIDAMFEAAKDELIKGNAELRALARVPGCYELPLAVKTVLARDDVRIVVVLGYIERGETLHGEVMGHVVHRALVELELEYGKPIGLGIIGPGATAAQAEERKDGYARAAVRAALSSYAVVKELADVFTSG